MSDQEYHETYYIEQDEIAEEQLLQEHNIVDDVDVDDHDDEDAVDQEEDHQNIELKNDSVQGFFSHHEPVYSIDINPIDENIIISGGGDDKSYLWRVDTGKQLFELSGHTDSVTSVIFSTDGQYVASGGMDGKVLVWKVGTGELVISLEGPDEIMWLSWHPKGNILLAGANDSTIWMWQIPKGNVMNVFAGHSSPVTAGQFTPDGKKIVSGSDDSTLIVWDPKSATATSRISGEDARFHNEGITSLAVNKDSSLVITGSTDKSAKLLNILNGNVSHLPLIMSPPDSVEAVGFSNSLPLAATGSLDNSLNIWDLNTFRLRQTSHHEDAITKLKWHDASSSSPHLITTSSVDHTVRVWDARTGDCVRVFSGHQDSVLDVGVSRDGRTIVSGGDDGACLVFKL